MCTDLDALRQGVGDCQLRHVVILITQRDKVVVDPRLVLAGVVEVEFFRLDLILAQTLRIRDVEVWKRAMYVSTYLLAGFGGSKHPNDWY